MLSILALPMLFIAACGQDETAVSGPAGESLDQAAAIAAAASQGGEAIWASCASCHGAAGEGNRALNAPSLVNQDSWYLKRQLQHFRTGLRGTQSGDVLGAQMAAIASGLPDDEAIDAVVAYIAELPDTVPATSVDGDVALGRDHYDMICGACHGPGGEGNDLLAAPRLAGIDDWYLVEQYRNFAKGWRGYHADDKYGKQMRMMSGVLPDDQVIASVFAYIQAQAAE
jgi:cytochrome c oxidase subunit 2